MMSILSGAALLETWREFCVFTCTTQFVVGRDPLFSKALLNLRHRFPFRKWQGGEGGSKCVCNKATKDIMITQTEFPVQNCQNSHVCCEKEDEKILLARLRFTRSVVKVEVSVGWLVRLVLMSHVSIATNSSTAHVAQVCASSMVVRGVHQHLDLGLKIRRVPVQDILLLSPR